MTEADSTPHDRLGRTLTRWNEIESLASGLAVQALQDLARDSEQYVAEVKAATSAKQSCFVRRPARTAALPMSTWAPRVRRSAEHSAAKKIRAGGASPEVTPGKRTCGAKP